MNKKKRRTLEAIFARPVSPSIRWNDVVSLVKGLDGLVVQREGSRVAFELNGKRAVFHQPHPQPFVGRNTVRDLRDFLEAAGVKP